MRSTGRQVDRPPQIASQPPFDQTYADLLHRTTAPFTESAAYLSLDGHPGAGFVYGSGITDSRRQSVTVDLSAGSVFGSGISVSPIAHPVRWVCLVDRVSVPLCATIGRLSKRLG